MTVRGGRGPWKASCAARGFSRDTPRCSRPLGTRRPFSALSAIATTPISLVSVHVLRPTVSVRAALSRRRISATHHLGTSRRKLASPSLPGCVLQGRPSAAHAVSQPRIVREQRSTTAELRGLLFLRFGCSWPGDENTSNHSGHTPVAGASNTSGPTRTKLEWSRL